MNQKSNCFQKQMVHGDAKHKHLRTHARRIIAITNHSHQVALNNNHRQDFVEHECDHEQCQ